MKTIAIVVVLLAAACGGGSPVMPVTCNIGVCRDANGEEVCIWSQTVKCCTDSHGTQRCSVAILWGWCPSAHNPTPAIEDDGACDVAVGREH